MIKAPDVNWLAIAPVMTLMIGAFVLLLLASFIRGRDRGLAGRNRRPGDPPRSGRNHACRCRLG